MKANQARNLSLRKNKTSKSRHMCLQRPRRLTQASTYPSERHRSSLVPSLCNKQNNRIQIHKSLLRWVKERSVSRDINQRNERFGQTPHLLTLIKTWRRLCLPSIAAVRFKRQSKVKLQWINSSSRKLIPSKRPWKAKSSTTYSVRALCSPRRLDSTSTATSKRTSSILSSALLRPRHRVTLTRMHPQSQALKEAKSFLPRHSKRKTTQLQGSTSRASRILGEWDTPISARRHLSSRGRYSRRRQAAETEKRT